MKATFRPLQWPGELRMLGHADLLLKAGSRRQGIRTDGRPVRSEKPLENTCARPLGLEHCRGPIVRRVPETDGERNGRIAGPQQPQQKASEL